MIKIQTYGHTKCSCLSLNDVDDNDWTLSFAFQVMMIPMFRWCDTKLEAESSRILTPGWVKDDEDTDAEDDDGDADADDHDDQDHDHGDVFPFIFTQSNTTHCVIINIQIPIVIRYAQQVTSNNFYKTSEAEAQLIQSGGDRCC